MEFFIPKLIIVFVSQVCQAKVSHTSDTSTAGKGSASQLHFSDTDAYAMKTGFMAVMNEATLEGSAGEILLLCVSKAYLYGAILPTGAIAVL